MSAILQGTTPSLEIKISSSDFAVDEVTKLELVFSNVGNVVTHGLTDVTVNTTENSFIYQFTEAETLALSPTSCLYWQARFGFSDGSIVGTRKEAINVSDLISEAVME